MTRDTEALAGFLNTIDFTHFCTFTTPNPEGVPGMRRKAIKLAQFIGAGYRSTMFWAAEKFDSLDGMKSTCRVRYPDSGVTDYTTSRYHFHALLKTDVHAIEIFDWYYSRFKGRCDIIRNTDPAVRQSASYYCAKYITKQMADYDIYFGQDIRNRDLGAALSGRQLPLTSTDSLPF